MKPDKKQSRMKALDNARAVAMQHVVGAAKKGVAANAAPDMPGTKQKDTDDDGDC